MLTQTSTIQEPLMLVWGVGNKCGLSVGLEGKNIIAHCHLLHFSGKTTEKQDSWNRLSEHVSVQWPFEGRGRAPTPQTHACPLGAARRWGCSQESACASRLACCLRIYRRRLVYFKRRHSTEEIIPQKSWLLRAPRATLPPAFHTHTHGHLDP